ARRHNLPVSLTPLFGRTQEETELTDLLTRPDGRLVTVTGPGGMGKSRLALAVGSALLARFPDGVFWVALAPLQQDEEMVTAIAEAVDFPFQRDKRSPQQQLLDYLARKEMFLLLDNCEHLLDGMSLVGEVLAAAPHVKILATSRERLHLSGETVYGLAGIDYGEANDSPSDAVQLFLHSVGLVRPGYRPEREELVQAARICRTVQGMPLAILLAATWAEVLAPGEIYAQIVRSLDFLEADLRDLPERQRSLRAVFDHSWARLSAAERSVFARLTLFQGGFTWEAAQTVAQASLRGLMGLVQKSLLSRSPAGRFEMHELLRQYGAEKLRGMAGEEEAVRARHATFYLDWLRDLAMAIYSARQLAVMGELKADWENIRLAWASARGRGEAELLAGAARTLAYYCEWYGLYHEGVALFRRGLEGLAGDETATGGAARIQLLLQQARFERLLGRSARCAELIDSTENLLGQLQTTDVDIRPLLAGLLRERAELLSNSDKLSAMNTARRSLALYETIDDDGAMAAILHVMGVIAFHSGKKTESIPLLEASLDISRQLGSHWEISYTLRVMGFSVYSATGNRDLAESYIREGCEVALQIGHRAGAVQAERDLGGIEQIRGNYAAAEAIHTRCRQAYEEFGDKYRSVETGMLELLFMTQQAKYTEARSFGQIVLAAARETGQKEIEGNVLNLLSGVAHAEGRYEDAYSRGMEAAAVFVAAGGSRVPGIEYASLAITALALDRADEARTHIIHALELGLKGGSLTALRVMVGEAVLLKAYTGELLRAIELHELVMSHPQMANDRQHADVVRRPLLERIAHLSADEIAQARERGRALDLKTVAAEVLAELRMQEI
ncbi:MAG: NB-ARC domain-containing protein, partial [Caldilineaceae bacterium]